MGAREGPASGVGEGPALGGPASGQPTNVNPSGRVEGGEPGQMSVTSTAPQAWGPTLTSILSGVASILKLGTPPKSRSHWPLMFDPSA